MIALLTNDHGAVKRSYLLSFLACLLFIALLGYGYFIHHRQLIIEQRRVEVAAIADLKAGQIRQWRRERLNDATVIRDNVMLAHRLQEYLNGHATAEVLDEFREWMKSLRLNRYHHANLLTPDGRLLVSGQEGTLYTPPDPVHLNMIENAVRNKKVYFSDFHRDYDTGEICINLIIPLQHADSKRSRVLAVLVLDIDPDDYLYPLIQTWPTPSLSAETILVERSGNDALFLNDVRHRKDTALALRLPLAQRNVPAVLAALGQEGTFEGNDYRSIAVLAATRSIPDSPWAIVAKVDTTEIFEPVVKRAWLVTLFSLGGAVAAGLVIYLFWNRKNALYLQKQYAAELNFNNELAKAASDLKILNNELEQRVEERTAELLVERNNLTLLLDSIPNPVFFKDLQGRYLGCNKAFEEFRGIRKEMLIGKTTLDTLPMGLAVENQNFDRKVISSPGNHSVEASTILADGSKHAIMYHKARFIDTRGEPAGLICVIQDITELRAAEEAIRSHNEELELKVRERTLSLENANHALDATNRELRSSRNKFTTLFELANDGIFIVDYSGTIIDVNRTGHERLGYGKDELVSAHLSLINAPKYAALIPERMQQLLTSGQIMFESVHVRKDGTTMPVEICVSRIELEGEQLVFSSVRDITERTIAEEKLHKLSRAVENSPATVVITNSSGDIEYVNSKFTEISGYTSEEAIGKNPRILNARILPPEFYTNLWTTIRNGKEWRGEFCNRKKNGDIHWEKASISPIRDDEGRITHFVAVKEDITEWKRTVEELQRAKDAADAANRSKSEFLANMSHEIRTPLNAIIGFSSLALKAGLPPRQHDYMRKISGAGESLLTIINDILDFSKIEAGKLEMETAEFRLCDALTHGISVVQQQAVEKNLNFLLALSPDIPANLIGDSHRLSQIIANLMGNAIKFTEKGEIKLAASKQEQKGTRIKLQFSVRDTGIGMSREHLDKLFQPFTQADGSTTRKFGGTGLGLSISRKLVEMMSGEIWCESTLQQGSTFYFTAWFGIGKETATVDGHGILRQRPGDDTATYDFTGSKILLVEDNEINQQLIVELLRDTGVTVDIANNGQEALEKITVAVTAYDLALMDIQMPVMDGYETTRRIRAEQRFSTLPIIAMTAHAMKEEQQRIAAIGIQGYITKPIDARTTLNIMNRYLWKPGNREASEPGEGAMVVPQRIAPAIPGIDCSGALERLDGNLELYFWVLQSFIDSHASSDDIIRDALNSGNRELAERTAHTVKGVSGVMGAETLQKLALMLENAIHSEVEESTIRDALNRYTGELHTLVRTIALAVQGEAGHEMTASPAEPCPAAIAPVLIRLHQYINGKDGRAERFLDDYRDLFADLPRDHLERLGKCLANFDFEGADASLKVLATLNGITLTPEENETPSW